MPSRGVIKDWQYLSLHFSYKTTVKTIDGQLIFVCQTVHTSGNMKTEPRAPTFCQKKMQWDWARFAISDYSSAFFSVFPRPTNPLSRGRPYIIRLFIYNCLQISQVTYLDSGKIDNNNKALLQTRSCCVQEQNKLQETSDQGGSKPLKGSKHHM